MELQPSGIRGCSNSRPAVLFIQHRRPSTETAMSVAEASQNFAEYYQASAPEVIAGNQVTRTENPKGGLRSQPEQSELSGGEKQKKTVLGLAPRTAFALIFIALLAVVGIVIGAVVGTKHENHRGTGKLRTFCY